MKGAYHVYCKDLSTLLMQWSDPVSNDGPAVNAELAKRNLAPLPALIPAAANRRCE
jgi:hypothetical protein